MAKATFYVVFDAEIRGDSVKQIRMQRATKNPGHVGGGEVQARFVVDIPDTAFIRLMPTIDVVLPEGFWTSQPITVVVPDPDDDPAGAL